MTISPLFQILIILITVTGCLYDYLHRSPRTTADKISVALSLIFGYLIIREINSTGDVSSLAMLAICTQYIWYSKYRELVTERLRKSK